MEQHLPAGCRVKFEDPNALHDFVLAVCPEEGFWQGGKFKFHIKVIDTTAKYFRFNFFKDFIFYTLSLSVV